MHCDGVRLLGLVTVQDPNTMTGCVGDGQARGTSASGQVA
jgi:hypothetical protein